MVEPSRANGHVDLRRIPEQLGGFFKHSAASKIFRLTENAQSFVAFFRTGIHTGSQYCGAPFRLTSQSSFIAYPAHIIAHDSHYGFRLQTLDGSVKSVPIIDLLLAVRSFTVGSVEPNLVHFAVIGKQLGQLTDEEFVVSGGVAVTFRVSVPRRKVDPELHSIFIASRTKFFHNVSLAVTPRR